MYQICYQRSQLDKFFLEISAGWFGLDTSFHNNNNNHIQMSLKIPLKLNHEKTVDIIL